VLVSSGVPFFTVGTLVGHRKITMTQRYSHLQDSAMLGLDGSLSSDGTLGRVGSLPTMHSFSVKNTTK